MDHNATQDCSPKAAMKEQAQILLGILVAAAFFIGYNGLIFAFAWSVETFETFRALAGFVLKDILTPGLIILLATAIIGPILYAVFKPSIHLGFCLLQHRRK